MLFTDSRESAGGARSRASVWQLSRERSMIAECRRNSVNRWRWSLNRRVLHFAQQFFCRCGRCSTRCESREGSPRIRSTLAHSPQSGLLIIRNKKRTEFVYLKRSASGFAFRRMTSKKKVNKQNMLFVERRTRQWWHHCAGEEAVNKFERLRKKSSKNPNFE